MKSELNFRKSSLITGVVFVILFVKFLIHLEDVIFSGASSGLDGFVFLASVKKTTWSV